MNEMVIHLVMDEKKITENTDKRKKRISLFLLLLLLLMLVKRNWQVYENKRWKFSMNRHFIDHHHHHHHLSFIILLQFNNKTKQLKKTVNCNISFFFFTSVNSKLRCRWCIATTSIIIYDWYLVYIDNEDIWSTWWEW